MDDQTVKWISRAILPYEGDVRGWLHRNSALKVEVDDIIQESYARIARSAKPSEIRNGRSYFFRVVRNLVIEHIRRQKLIRIDALAEIDASFVIDDKVTAEQQLQDREELSYVLALMDRLPARCREILHLRRVEGLSQKETALRVGVSENVVEKQTAMGLRKLLECIRNGVEAHGFAPREMGSRAKNRVSR